MALVKLALYTWLYVLLSTEEINVYLVPTISHPRWRGAVMKRKSVLRSLFIMLCLVLYVTVITPEKFFQTSRQETQSERTSAILKHNTSLQRANDRMQIIYVQQNHSVLSHVPSHLTAMTPPHKVQNPSRPVPKETIKHNRTWWNNWKNEGANEHVCGRLPKPIRPDVKSLGLPSLINKMTLTPGNGTGRLQVMRKKRSSTNVFEERGSQSFHCRHTFIISHEEDTSWSLNCLPTCF